ncbi:MAG: N-acetyltransferase [Bacillaceae bacterium]|nr:N-acetyltransferase [Bacillaceae bacterium]
MEIKVIKPEQLDRVRKNLIQFIYLHGDKRITKKAINWFRQVAPEELHDQGNLILAAVHDHKIKGILAVADYGRKESFAVVHRDSRQSGIGIRMVDEALRQMNKLYGRVAVDNIPSMKMCLSLGMVGFKMTTGPTGKPTLWFGAGDWKREDVELYTIS